MSESYWRYNPDEDPELGGGPQPHPVTSRTLPLSPRIGPAVRPRRWTTDDVYYVGTALDQYGRILVTLRRGSIVQHVRVRATEPDPAAAALAAANGAA